MIQLRQAMGNFRDQISVIDSMIARAVTPIGALSDTVQGFPSYEDLSLISTVQNELDHHRFFLLPLSLLLFNGSVRILCCFPT
jgi:hypothetical protein